MRAFHQIGPLCAGKPKRRGACTSALTIDARAVTSAACDEWPVVGTAVARGARVTEKHVPGRARRLLATLAAACLASSAAATALTLAPVAAQPPVAASAVAPAVAPSAGRPVPEVPVQPCSRYAAPDGDDANAGTKAAPVKNISALTQKLAPGQTGCIRDGSTITMDGPEWSWSYLYGGSPGLPKIVRPETPGSRATLVTTTQFHIGPGQSDLVLQDLDLVKTGSSAGSAVGVDGDRITFDGIDLTWSENICLDVGGDARADPPQWDRTAEDFVLIDSRVHDCGTSHVNDPGDPGGSHGVYLQLTRDGSDADGWGAIIYNSLFDFNKDRGIQLYPDADDVLVDRVVLYGNGSNLNVGSDTSGPGDPTAVRSDRARIRGSIIANSRLDAYPPYDNPNSTATADVLGNFAYGVGAGAGNLVQDSCLYNEARNDHLFEVTGNDRSALDLSNVTLDQPATFMGVAARDFRLAPGSACAGTGLADASRLPGGAADQQPVGDLSLVDAATDNYKTWKDGASRPGVGVEARTSLLFDGVTVGGTTYVVPTSQLAAIGSGNGAPQPLASGIPLATAPGAPVSAYLQFAQPANAATDTAYYRVFSRGTFGLYSVVDRATFQQSPLSFPLSLRSTTGATLATLPLTYRHDAGIAALPSSSLEYGGPNGRWLTGPAAGSPTPLNWPADLAVSTTPGGAQQNTIQVRASTPEQLWVTPVDVDGLPVPRFRDWDGNVLQLDVLKGATTLTQTTGTGTSRSFTVDQPAGSYAFSLKGYCDGYCAVDYVDVPLQRGFSLEAGAGRLPAAPGTPVAQAGDGQASVSWPATPDAGSGTGLTYTVVAARTGDAGAGTHSCQTTTLSCTVTGLSNLAGSAEPYTFRVRATTSVGSSGWSADSNAVWPHVAVVPVYRPDLSVDTGSGAVGAGVVNASGDGQLVDVPVTAGSSATVRVLLTNAGDTTDTFGLAEARGGQYAAFTRTWTRDGADVTADLSPDVGWHQVADVPAGGQRELQLTVGVPAGAAAGTTATYALHGYHSPASAGIKDVVVVRVTATAAPVTTTPPPTTQPPVDATPPAPGGKPATRLEALRYTGRLVVGHRLVARCTTDPGTRLTYTWLRGPHVITGATKRSYVLRARDRGKRITLRVTARADQHTRSVSTYRGRGRVG
jgi:hypothetical protein